MAAQIQEIIDSPSIRAEIAEYLMRSPGKRFPTELWLKRMAHWWDENPAASQLPQRGWVLRDDDGVLQGFLAAIPMWYALGGERTAVVVPSTWRVNEEHRHASIPMLMKLLMMGRRVPLVDTSPNARVREIFDRAGLQVRRTFQRHLFLRGGWLGSFGANLGARAGAFPTLDSSLRFVSDASEVKRIARPFVREDRLEKWITPEYLRWHSSSPLDPLRFVGVVDAEGTLTSYVLLSQERLVGRPSWLVADWFTTRDDGLRELFAIIGKLCHEPGFGFVSVASMEDDAWDDSPSLWCGPSVAKHYFMLPASFAGVEKRCVLAEGDWGL